MAIANSQMTEESQITTRRTFLIGAAHFAGGAGLVSVVSPASATPASMLAAIKKVVGQAPLRTGKVTIDIPPLVENGNTVPMVVTVETPMTATNYVKAIYVFNEKNRSQRSSASGSDRAPARPLSQHASSSRICSRSWPSPN